MIEKPLWQGSPAEHYLCRSQYFEQTWVADSLGGSGLARAGAGGCWPATKPCTRLKHFCSWQCPCSQSGPCVGGGSAMRACTAKDWEQVWQRYSYV